jgi:hypothetical protein
MLEVNVDREKEGGNRGCEIVEREVLVREEE